MYIIPISSSFCWIKQCKNIAIESKRAEPVETVKPASTERKGLNTNRISNVGKIEKGISVIATGDGLI